MSFILCISKFYSIKIYFIAQKTIKASVRGSVHPKTGDPLAQG